MSTVQPNLHFQKGDECLASPASLPYVELGGGDVFVFSTAAGTSAEEKERKKEEKIEEAVGDNNDARREEQSTIRSEAHLVQPMLLCRSSSNNEEEPDVAAMNAVFGPPKFFEMNRTHGGVTQVQQGGGVSDCAFASSKIALPKLEDGWISGDISGGGAVEKINNNNNNRPSPLLSSSPSASSPSSYASSTPPTVERQISPSAAAAAVSKIEKFPSPVAQVRKLAALFSPRSPNNNSATAAAAMSSPRGSSSSVVVSQGNQLQMMTTTKVSDFLYVCAPQKDVIRRGSGSSAAGGLRAGASGASAGGGNEQLTAAVMRVLAAKSMADSSSTAKGNSNSNSSSSSSSSSSFLSWMRRSGNDHEGRIAGSNNNNHGTTGGKRIFYRRGESLPDLSVAAASRALSVSASVEMNKEVVLAEVLDGGDALTRPPPANPSDFVNALPLRGVVVSTGSNNNNNNNSSPNSFSSTSSVRKKKQRIGGSNNNNNNNTNGVMFEDDLMTSHTTTTTSTTATVPGQAGEVEWEGDASERTEADAITLASRKNSLADPDAVLFNKGSGSGSGDDDLGSIQVVIRGDGAGVFGGKEGSKTIITPSSSIANSPEKREKKRPQQLEQGLSHNLNTESKKRGGKKVEEEEESSDEDDDEIQNRSRNICASLFGCLFHYFCCCCLCFDGPGDAWKESVSQNDATVAVGEKAAGRGRRDGGERWLHIILLWVRILSAWNVFTSILFLVLEILLRQNLYAINVGLCCYSLVVFVVAFHSVSNRVLMYFCVFFGFLHLLVALVVCGIRIGTAVNDSEGLLLLGWELADLVLSKILGGVVLLNGALALKQQNIEMEMNMMQRKVAFTQGMMNSLSNFDAARQHNSNNNPPPPQN